MAELKKRPVDLLGYRPIAHEAKPNGLLTCTPSGPEKAVLKLANAS